MTSLLCRFGVHCRAATRSIGEDGRSKRLPAEATGRGLCVVCERFGRTAVDELGRLYGDLHAELGKDTGRNVQPGGGASHGNAKVDPPTPLRLHVDAWCREIAWALSVWAEAVGERVDALPRPAGALTVATQVRMGAWRCSRVLVTYYSVLLALPVITHVPYVGDGALADPVDLDGPDAVVQLVDLYERARRWAGEGQRMESRHMPCPPVQAGGCGQDGVLVQDIGSESVRCSKCGWTCTDLEYERYAITLKAPVRLASAGAVL